MDTKKPSVFQKLFAVYRGHPFLLLIVAGGITGSIVLGYRNFLLPWADRRRRLQAQQYADYLFEKNEKRKMSNESHSN